MSKLTTDGLSRLQNQSRISATTWRQWCNLLKLDPTDAIDVWQEVCFPIMVATRKVPEVPYILQMRAARFELDIFDFKEEVPKLLHIITFLYALKDDRGITGKPKSALLTFYRKTALESPPGQPHDLFIQKFIVDLCAAMLVAKVLPTSNISLAGVLKPIVEGHGDIDQIIGLGLKASGDKPYASKIRECFAARENVANDPLSVEGDDLNDEVGEEADEEVGDEVRVNAGAKDGDDDDEVDDDDYDEDGDAIEVYLAQFKNALRAIYESEIERESELTGEQEESRVQQAEALHDERLTAIAEFKPLQAIIPSAEEAQMIAKRAEAKSNPSTVSKWGSSGRLSGGVALVVGGVAARGVGGAREAGVPTAEFIKSGEADGRTTAKDTKVAGQSAHSDVEFSVDVAAADMVEPDEVSLPELSSKAHEIGKLLSSIERNDQQVWGLLIEPTTQLQNLRAMARQICTAGTGADKAYNNVKQIACYLKLKDLLNVKESSLRQGRNFMIEIRTFINSVNYERKLESDSRQLAPLKRILDNAAATMVRLEALKTNFNFSLEHPESYTREGVTLYYEEALRALTDLADADTRGAARHQADADTDALLATFYSEQFVEKLLQTVRTYIVDFRDSGRVNSLSDFKAACGEKPIEFEDVEERSEEAEALPDELLVAGTMGDVIDEANRYIITQAWAVLQAVHQPEVVAGRIKDILCEVLVGIAVFTAEMRRHQDDPTKALAVVGLDKITGNINLKEYYVRVRSSGAIAFLEHFEDGKHVDLFEMREYKPSRVHAAAQKEKDEDGTEELLTGRKYLFTIGRTEKLFSDTPNDLINGCIRDEGGRPKVF